MLLKSIDEINGEKHFSEDRNSETREEKEIENKDRGQF
jgi:hypothetical protein